MTYFNIKPEVPAGFGEKTVFNDSIGQEDVSKVHLVFDGWLGDDLLTTSPIFYVTEKLAIALKGEKFSGLLKIESIEFNKSENFEEFYPDRVLPNFFVLRINGVPLKDDIGIATEESGLMISDSVYEFLKDFNLKFAKIREI